MRGLKPTYMAENQERGIGKVEQPEHVDADLIGSLRELHAKTTAVGEVEWCVECGHCWPCATIRALDFARGEAGSHSNPEVSIGKAPAEIRHSKRGTDAAEKLAGRSLKVTTDQLIPLGKAREPLTITLSREDAYALTYACTAYLGGTDGVKHRMPLAKLRDKLDEAQGGESL
jgi:hypothetical protein